MDIITSIYLVIIPPVITIGGNYFFYSYIKGNVDKSIERHKIAYSGIFKERINVYREIQKQIYDISLAINQYLHVPTPEKTGKIKGDFTLFINYCQTNEFLLSEKLFMDIKKLCYEYQSVFEDIVMFNSALKNIGANKDEYTMKYSESINKLRGKYFIELGNIVVKEMRTDLRVDDI